MPCVVFAVVQQPKVLVPRPHVQQWPTPQDSAALTLQAAWASIVPVAQHYTGTAPMATAQVSTAVTNCQWLLAGSADRRSGA